MNTGCRVPYRQCRLGNEHSATRVRLVASFWRLANVFNFIYHQGTVHTPCTTHDIKPTVNYPCKRMGLKENIKSPGTFQSHSMEYMVHLWTHAFSFIPPSISPNNLRCRYSSCGQVVFDKLQRFDSVNHVSFAILLYFVSVIYTSKHHPIIIIRRNAHRIVGHCILHITIRYNINETAQSANRLSCFILRSQALYNWWIDSFAFQITSP